nr:MAG TPA: Neck appendage protein [Bacteriophage sp.]
MGKTLGYGEFTVANVTEPFTVMLTNEAQQFATDSNRKVTSAQSYYTDIIVIRGSQERTDYTIGNITSGSGITVSKSSKRVTFSVSAGTTIGADTGVIEIPITLDGQTVKKQFSWSCGKQGPQGVQGNDGNSFAWNMLSETNCGKKHWGTESSGGKYSVEDFITEDNIDAVKLICTEAISTSNWSYVSFKDIKMLKQLKPSTKYTLSYDIKANRSGAISHSICKGDVSNFCTNTVVVNNIIGNETWQHISVVLTTNDLKTTPTNEILYLGRNALSKVGYSIIKNLKLVEGDIDTPWSPSQSDIEGKGVVETVQYYLATSQASGVASSTSGWSTDITTQKLTADKKYLWNCYQTKYSDGTSEPISTPKVIGVYGDKGQKGENAKNLSITPSSQYFKSTDGGKTFAPDTIAIKPTIQGEISFGKWQYSIDGGVSFADVVSGQKGLTISNNVLTVNKDSSLYSDAVTMVTFRAVANDSSFYDTCSIAKIYDVSDIGDGRNLIQKSQLNPIDGAELSLDDYTKNGTVIFTNKSENSGFSFDSYNNYQPNSKYVLSYYFTKTSGTMNSFGGSHNGKGVVYTSFFVDDKVYDTASYAGGSSQIGTILNDGKRHRIVVCYTTPDTIATDTSVNYTFIQPGRGNTNPNFGVKIEELKLEKGSSPTGWSPAPEDLQTAILSTKSEISDVSLKVDNNKQAIEQRVEKTTYQQDLKLVKGDISKANEGLNKWRYEIYPKSLFTSEYQGKSTMDVFAKNTNLTPSQSVLINDTDFGKNWAYGDNYIGYALTFVKFSATKSVAITFKHDDGAHLYLNGKLIGGDDTCNTGSGESLTLSFIQGWNCLEVVLNEKSGGEYIGLGTTISAISECQLMNCYYGTPVARQSHITNQLVQNTTDIDGVSGSVQKVMSTVGGSGKIDEFVSNYATWKKKVDGIETRVGETYTTKDDFDDLQIGGRNLLKHSSMIGEKLICDNYFICNNCNIQEYTNDGFHIITPTEGNANNGIAFAFDNFTIMEINGGDTITFSCDIKGTSDSHAPFVSIHISDNNWYGSGVVQKNTNVSITKDWQRVSVTITTPTGLTKNHMWLAIHGNHQSDLYVRNFKLEKGNKPTDWTPAPEDVNGKIVNVETIANQTADKFSWIVKSGTSSSNFEITDRLMNLVSANINLDGIVSFMNTAKGDGRKNLYNLDYSSFENVASQEDAICYAKDNGVTSVGIDSSVSYDGDKSLKISYTTANLNSSTTPLYLGSSANNYGCVKIQAGKQYILSCYVKSDSTTGLFMIDIQGHDTPDTKTDGLYLSNIDPRKLPGSSTGVNLSTDWQRAVCAIKVADNATGLYWSVVPLIWGRPSSSSAPQTFNVWVDCIMLEEVDSISNEPGTYIFDKETIIDGGSIKTDTITGNQILAGSITADKIATDAIKSHNYISSGGTQGSFLNLGDGSFTSPNLSWDSNGNLIASNANLSGLINATKGTVGGWNIATNGLYSGIDENAIKIYSATTYDAQTMYQKQKIQDSFILSQKYINHFVSQQVSVGHNIPYWQTRSFIYNDSQIQLAQSDYCINTSSASNYDAQYSLKDGYISATRIYMEQNITQVGGDVINSSFSIGLDSMMGWCSIQSTKGINIYGNSSRALYVQSNDTSKYNALETEGDVVVNGKIHAVSGDNKIQLNSDNNGSIELYGNTPFIDFHSAYSSADYTCRIIANTPEQLLVCGKLRCDSNIISNNDLIANSWVYAGQNAHYTWQNQLDCYFSCGYYNNTNNVYYYAGYHAFYVNNDSGSGMMYINTNGVTSRVGFTKTSDERIKKNFESFDDNIIDAYMNIEPVKYQLKQSSNDNYHFGFKAQHIDKIFSDYGDTYNESFDICTSRPIDPDKAKELYGVDGMVEEYGLRYDELIAPTTYMVQHIYKELEQVKQEKADLETRLQAIEAKLRL